MVGCSVLPTPYQFAALSYTIWVMPSPMKTAPGWTKYFQTITSSLVSVPTISQLTVDAELRGRKNGRQLGNAGAAYLPEMAMLDGDHLAILDGKYILCIWVLFGLLRAIKQGDEMRVFTLTPGQGLFILPLSLGKKKKKHMKKLLFCCRDRLRPGIHFVLLG